MKSIICLVSSIILGVQLASSHLQYPENSCPETLGNDPVLMEITDNCTHFIKCDNNGVAQPIPCPDGLIFDSDFNVCVRPSETTRPDCGSNTTTKDDLDVVTPATLYTAVPSGCTCPPPRPPHPPPNPLCPDHPIPQFPPHRIPIPGDCFHYVEFDHYGIGHYLHCPWGQVYDIVEGCVPLNESNRPDCCPVRPTPPTPPTPTSTTPQPPAPTTEPPAPTTQPPAPTTQPPAPTTQPPAPTTQPPAPTTEPPAPTTQPPAPTTQPPAPTTQPPAPTTQPPAPTTQPPAPTTPAIPTHPCSNTTSADIVGFDNYPGCPKGPIVDDDQYNLEIEGDCNHFVHCDNFGKGWCKVCAYAVPPLVFDKSVDPLACIWARDSTRTDCGN